MKNSNDTIDIRTRDFPACSAVPQSTAPLRVRVQYSTVQYSTVQYSTVQYSTVPPIYTPATLTFKTR